MTRSLASQSSVVSGRYLHQLICRGLQGILCTRTKFFHQGSWERKHKSYSAVWISSVGEAIEIIGREVNQGSENSCKVIDYKRKWWEREMLKSWETESFDWNRHLNGSESLSWQWLVPSMTGWPCSQEMRYWLIPLLPLSSHFPLLWCFSSSCTLCLLHIFRLHGTETWFIIWEQVSKCLLSICSAGALL